MNRKIESQFLASYILMFFITTLIAISAYMFLNYSNHIVSENLVKNKYTAKSLMKDDYNYIDAAPVVENGGGVQVINSDHEVVYSAGINTIPKNKLTTAEFTEFLRMSSSMGVPYSYNIEYNSEKHFWLVVTFPTSLRIDFAIVHNKDFLSVDMQYVVRFFLAVILFYIVLITVSTVMFSKLIAGSIINPLKRLCNSVRRFKEGDYSSRVNLNLKNEFGELEEIFNEMAHQVEQEISLRKQSEENRKKVVLDISHDLKNPLAGIMGYAEFCYSKPDLSEEERSKYMKIIYENSLRANNLITDLFELSKMESTEYAIKKIRVDICEYLREEIGAFIAVFDKAGFKYEFDIPEKEIFLEIDKKQMNRVFQNLVDNSVQYNPKGTEVAISLHEQKDDVVIVFKDNGIGIPPEVAKDIFQPFVRVDCARNSQTGGTGLGLAIVEKIIGAHGGSISLKTDEHCGCEFIITIPKI